MADPVRMHPVSHSTAVVSTAVSTAKPYELRSPIAQLLNREGARAAIQPMLRPGESYERIVVEVYHAASKNADILKCTPQSIVSAVARSVATGLIIGEGVHLVPFGDRLEMVLDYKGCAELVLMSRACRYLDAQCHYEKEPFEYEQGSSPFVRHRPIVDPRSRGALVGAYAVAKVTRDDVRIVYMAVEEIDAIRKAKSKAWKSGPLSAIPWYAKKTVIKQIVKLLPKNRELAQVMALMDREDGAEDLDADQPAALHGGDRLDDETPRAPQPERPAITYPLSPVASGDEPEPDPSQALEESGPAIEPATDEDWTPPGEEPPSGSAVRQRYAVEQIKMPFGGDRVGRPLWQVSTDDLGSAHQFALRSKNAKQWKPFIDAAEAVLEMRRLGDIPEPTAEELAAPKPTGEDVPA